jgi:hypothetical protein
MSLKMIHELLREEYAVSRHVWWTDDESGDLVNDVTHTLRLIHKTAECLRRGDEDCWRELVVYCIERSMSYIVMFAIGEYLADCGELEPLPLIDLTPDNSRKSLECEVTLTEDVTRIFQLHAKTAKPEADRDIAFKGEHRWARYKPRLKDDHPVPEKVNTTSKSIHWLF